MLHLGLSSTTNLTHLLLRVVYYTPMATGIPKQLPVEWWAKWSAAMTLGFERPAPCTVGRFVFVKEKGIS